VVADPERAESAFENLSFFLAGSGRRVLLFPEYDILPYDRAAPATDVIATRLRTLEALLAPAGGPDAGPDRGRDGPLGRAARPGRPVPSRAASSGFVPATPSTSTPSRRSFSTSRSSRRTWSRLPGSTCRRGGIFDVFSYAHENPVRIELDGDLVSSLREFDPRDQRSIRKLDEARVLPATEFPLRASDLAGVRAALSGAAPGQRDEIDTLLDALEKDRRFAGWSAPPPGSRPTSSRSPPSSRVKAWYSKTSRAS